MMPRALLMVSMIALFRAGAAAQTPPRDIRRPGESSTARIAGTVRSADSPARPLRRARVLLNGDALQVGRTAIADDTGAFAFEGLPPGRYTLSATKEAYVTAAFGARRPQRPGRSIALRSGETRRITLRLPRGAVITGTVLDPEGQPAPGVNVIALTTRYSPAVGERRLVNAGTTSTDDRGIYRFYGLAPGGYVVSAGPRGPTDVDVEILSESEVRRALAAVRDSGTFRSRPGIPSASPPLVAPEPRRTVALAPVYYPGTTFASRASPIEVAAGEVRAGIDFQLDYMPTVTVSGLVSEPALLQLMPSVQSGPITNVRGSRAGPDGRFSFSGVTPGEYTVIARTFAPAPLGTSSNPAAVPKAAQTDIVVNGEEMAGVSLALQPGVTLKGRLVFEGESTPPIDLPGARLPMPASLRAGPMVIAFPPLQLDGDRRFSVSGVLPGSYQIAGNAQGLRTPLRGWWLKSVTSRGAELLDAPLDLREDRDDVVVTFAARASEVSGRVRDAAGNAWSDGFVVIFSTDRNRWFFNSRRVAGARPNRDGRYEVRNLPAGEYFVVAHDDVEAMEWFDPQMLEQLAPAAARFRIGETEKKTHDLVVR